MNVKIQGLSGEIYSRLQIIICSLQQVHEVNDYGASCLSIHMIQLKNCWTDLDRIWYGRCAILVYPKIVIFDFLQSVIPRW
jgi:hypothetical protein